MQLNSLGRIVDGDQKWVKTSCFYPNQEPIFVEFGQFGMKNLHFSSG
jgi:hypothetical protein